MTEDGAGRAECPELAGFVTESWRMAKYSGCTATVKWHATTMSLQGSIPAGISHVARQRPVVYPATGAAIVLPAKTGTPVNRATRRDGLPLHQHPVARHQGVSGSGTVLNEAGITSAKREFGSVRAAPPKQAPYDVVDGDDVTMTTSFDERWVVRFDGAHGHLRMRRGRGSLRHRHHYQLASRICYGRR